MEIDILILRLKSNRNMKINGAKLRGYFATAYNDRKLFHHHDGDSFIYRYPLVQYKVIGKTPTIVAIQEGVKEVTSLYADMNSIMIDSTRYDVYEKSMAIKKQEIGESDKFFHYRFITPWFALNQKNYRSYRELSSRAEKEEFLSRILVGNILSLSKSLGYTVRKRLKCAINVKSRGSMLKNVKIMVFSGKFAVNFRLPDYIGLGKSVSRGFGTIKRLEQCN